MNGTAPIDAGSGWLPGSMTEWVVYAVVLCFLWIVKRQQDGQIPMLTEISAGLKSLPSAIKEAVRDGVCEAEKLREQARDRAHAERQG